MPQGSLPNDLVDVPAGNPGSGAGGHPPAGALPSDLVDVPAGAGGTSAPSASPGNAPGQSGEQFLAARDPKNQEGTVGAIGEDIAGAGSSLLHMVRHPIDTAVGAAKNIAQSPDRYRARVASGRSPLYSAVATGGEDVLPINVAGMEQAADTGDTGAILGHTVTGAAASLAPSAMKASGRLAGKVAPPKLINLVRDEPTPQFPRGKVGDISILGTKVPSGVVDRVLPAREVHPDAMAGARREATNEYNTSRGQDLMKRQSEQDALDAAHEGRLKDAVAARQKEITDTERLRDQDATARSRRVPPEPPSGMTHAAPERAPANPRAGAATPAQDMAARQQTLREHVQANVAGRESKVPITRLPEPNAPGPGINPANMASVPRDSLLDLARSGTPGAGKQLQQIGERPLYEPRGTGYPAPRSVTRLKDIVKEK